MRSRKCNEIPQMPKGMASDLRQGPRARPRWGLDGVIVPTYAEKSAPEWTVAIVETACREDSSSEGEAQ